MSNEPEQSTDNPQIPPTAGQPPAPTPEPTPGSTPGTTQEPVAPAPGGQPPGADKKLVSGILGILLGSLGVHKFYLGYTKEGIIMLAVFIVGMFLCGIPSMAVWAVGLAEGIIYLTKPDEEFAKTYVVGRRPWF